MKRPAMIYFTILTLSVASTRPFKNLMAFSSSSLLTKCGVQLGFDEVLA